MDTNKILEALDKLDIELFLFDEAQLSEEEGIRGMRFDSFVRRVDKNCPTAKKVFTHPFINNPEAQLKKHGFQNQSSDSKLYEQHAVGKMYLSHENGIYSYFSPFDKPKDVVVSEMDIVKEKLLNNSTILVYTSKAKIYDNQFIDEFAEYIDLCPKITDPKAREYIDQLKDFIGASDTDNDKKSIMINLMERGVVVHHGSIPLKGRLIIEEFVNKNFARICFATSTLTQGINMPFDVVWIKNFKFSGSEDRKILDLKNLIGRAGRTTNKIGKFDYGYVIIESINVNKFCKRLKSLSTISEQSKLDEHIENIPEDQKDIVEAIKNDTFDDELQLTDAQVERVKDSDLDQDILFILDNFFSEGKPITGKMYYDLPTKERIKIKEAFKKIYVSHLRRKDLSPAELAVLATAIPVLLWQIQGKSFSEIIALRYALVSHKDERRVILRRLKRNEISQKEANEELEKLLIRYSPAAEQIPNINLKNQHGLYPLNTPVTELEYDVLVYDTYDYIDKVISLSLKDPLSAAFLIYYEKTEDIRAVQISNYIKYGTNDENEIWLVRYGFSFDDIEWIIPHVTSISEDEIVFKDSIHGIDDDKRKIIERFI